MTSLVTTVVVVTPRVASCFETAYELADLRRGQIVDSAFVPTGVLVTPERFWGSRTSVDVFDAELLTIGPVPWPELDVGAVVSMTMGDIDDCVTLDASDRSGYVHRPLLSRRAVGGPQLQIGTMATRSTGDIQDFVAGDTDD